MAKKATIVTAPAGRGKTHYLLDRLADHINSLDKYEKFRPQKIIVVPYAEQAKRLKDLLMPRVPEDIFFSEPIISYNELVKKIFPEIRGRGISNIQKKLILEEVLETVPFQYYESVRDLKGLSVSLSSFVSEWKGLFLSQDDFDIALKLFPEDSIQILKLTDLKSVFSAYENRKKALGFSDFDDSLKHALSRPAVEWGFLDRIDEIWFDGFYDFLPNQVKLLDCLKERVAISVLLTHETDPAGQRKNLFEITHNTARKLKKVGFEERSAEVALPGNQRTKQEDLIHIERTVFSSGRPTEIIPENIKIFEGVGLSGEIKWIAREILRLKRKGELFWSDIAVLLREVGGYQPILEEVFREFDIPYVIHERNRLRENKWICHLLNGLKIIQNGLEDPSLLFDFLKSSYLKLPYEVISDFESFSESEGFWEDPEGLIQGLGRWKEQLPKEESGKVDIVVDEIRMLLSFAANWNKGFELEDFENFLKDCPTRWGKFGDEQLDGTIDAADMRAHEKLKDIVLEIRLNQEIRKKKISFSGFLLSLEEGVHMSLFSFPAPVRDAIQIYTVQMARQKEYRIVFVAGLLQKNFPGVIKEDVVLKDAERKILSRFGLECRLPRSSHERYYFYLALTRASEKIYLTYPRYDLEGKESLPSFFIDEVNRLFKTPILTVRENRTLSIPEPEDAVTVKDLKNHLAYELGDRVSAGAVGEKKRHAEVLYNFLLSHGERLEINEISLPGRKDIRLSKKDLKEGLKGKEVFSPTALETYGACPVRFFLQKILKPNEPVSFDSPLIQGTLLHELLEVLLPRMIDEVLSDGEVRLIIEEKLKVLDVFRLKPYEKKLLVDSFFEYLKQIFESERERLRETSFKPTLFEKTASFGKGEFSAKPALKLTFGKISFNLIGEIDRVDVDPKTSRAVVVDYKTGKSRTLSKREIEKGIHLQLPLYGIALRELFSYAPNAYEIYSIKSAKPSKTFDRSKDNSVDIKIYEGLALEYAAQYVQNIRKGIFPVTPKKCPDSCPFNNACRFEKWRKIELGVES